MPLLHLKQQIINERGVPTITHSFVLTNKRPESNEVKLYTS